MAEKMSSEKLKGKVALITGSSDGIGAGIAIEFAKEGAFIALTGRTEEKLKKVAEKCKEEAPKYFKVLTIAGDINDEKVRQLLIEKTVKTLGKIDILVNNAGTFNMTPITENHGLKPLDDMLNIHVRAPYHLTKLAMDQLIANKGIIINISSVLAKRPSPSVPMMEYCMGKSALDQFTYWLARELGPKGVRVNSINPGAIRTNIFEAPPGVDKEKMFEEFGKLHALQRMGYPDEVGRVAVFLASKDSSFVTGITLLVDGGQNVMPVSPLKT